MDFTLKRKIANFSSTLLILLGVGLILLPLIATNYSKIFSLTNQENPKVILLEEKKSDEFPKSIKLAEKEVPISIGHFENNEWTLAKDNALYLSSSGLLGKKGNVVLYGHNSDKIFNPIFKLKKGDKIFINSNLDKEYLYEVEERKSVYPSDMSILEQSNSEEKITLFTCSGLFDSERFVIVGKRV